MSDPSPPTFDDVCQMIGVDANKMRLEREAQKKREAEAKPKQPPFYMQVLAQATADWAAEMQRRAAETDKLLKEELEKEKSKGKDET